MSNKTAATKMTKSMSGEFGPLSALNAKIDKVVKGVERQVKAKKAAFAKARKATNGKTDAEVKNDMATIQRAYDLRKDGASFAQIEIVMGLRQTNGMTAYRLIQRAKKLARSK